MTDEQTPPEGEPTPVNRVVSVWDDVVADMEATAEELRAEGFAVLEVHPGDVAAMEGREGHRWGLDVLVPDNEFPEIERLVEEEGHEFDACRVFRAEAKGLALFVVAMLDEDGDQALVFPAYYDKHDGQKVLEKANEEGEMRTHLRPLDERTVVTFTQDDPSLFEPEHPI